jgi:hypothetical protein
MVEVFKTNVHQHNHAIMLLSILLEQFPMFKINFDLEDCDRILRVEGTNISAQKIIELLRSSGYQCEVLS